MTAPQPGDFGLLAGNDVIGRLRAFPSLRRCWHRAEEALEMAATWAVKAITHQNPPERRA